MPLVPNALETVIRNALGFSGEPPSPPNLGLATAIITHIQSSTVVFAPGTITGSPGIGPIPDAEGSNGIMTPTAPLLPLLVNVFGGSTPELAGYANAITTHLLTAEIVFPVGTIIAVSGATPVAPGPVTGSGAGGQISGLDGDTLADLITTGIGQASASPELKAKCNDMVSYIEGNAAVSLPALLGTAGPGGTPLVIGAPAGIIL